MSLNRREMLRLGAVGAGGAMLSSAASSVGLPSIVFQAPPAAVPLPPVAAPRRRRRSGIDPHAVPARQGGARFAPDRRPRLHRHRRFLAGRRASRASTSSTCATARSKATASPTAAARIPTTRASSSASPTTSARYATSNGTYTTGEYYHGKYGLSMKVRGLDWSNNNAEAARDRHPQCLVRRARHDRACTASSAAREGCFAFSRADQWKVMASSPAAA